RAAASGQKKPFPAEWTKGVGLSRSAEIGYLSRPGVHPSFRAPCPPHFVSVHEVLWDRRFDDVFTQTEDGRLAIDYRRLHDTRPIPIRIGLAEPETISRAFSRRQIADPNKIRAFCYCTVRILVRRFRNNVCM